MKVEQENSQATKADITVKNLSMRPSSNGNVMVKLLDEVGKVVETRFVADTSADLLALGGEESVTKEIRFSKLGRRVVAEYFTADPDSMTHEISAITLSGINMGFDKEVKNYHLTANNINNTIITVIAKNSEDTVELRGANGSTLLASGKGAVTYSWQLPGGQSSRVQVRIAENSTDVYSINVTSVQKNSGTVNLSVPENNIGRASIGVTAVGLTDFVPARWQYSKDGVWSEQMDWKPAGPKLFVIYGIGLYTVAVRLFDTDGYYIDSTSMVVTIRKDNSSSSETNNNQTNAPGTTEFTLPAIVNGNEAEVDLGALPEDIFNSTTAPVIKIPGVPGVNSYILGFPADYLSGTDRIGTLTFVTELGAVTLSTDMLGNIPAAKGEKVKITFGLGNKSDLPESTKEIVGGRPLIQLTLTINGKQVEWNNPKSPITVTIPYVPTEEEKKHPESIVIWYIDASGKAVSVPNGHYDSDSGTVTFKTTHFSYYAVGYNKTSFKDVADNAWYSKAVDFAAARGITVGVGDGKFLPDGKLTRGQFIVMVMRAYGIEADENPKDNFADSGDTYYTGYLAASKRIGISNGIGNNMFAPEKEITRQEMFTLLYNTLKSVGGLPSGETVAELSAFADANLIASWAKNAVTLFVKTGTVRGSGGNLDPAGTLSRAQMAQTFYNLLSN